MLLCGKAAVVTGSTRGIGHDSAIGLAKAGAKVVVNGRKQHECETTVEEIKAAGGTAVACSESVATWAGCQRIIETCVESFGRIDILVNNAAIIRNHMLFNMTEDEWDKVIDIDMKGGFACAHFASIHMRQQQGGRIINMISDGGLRGWTGTSNYNAAKGGLAAMTRGWALELMKYHITVNAVAPNARTEMLASDDPAKVEALKVARGIPVLKISDTTHGGPEKVTPLIVYLASDEAANITGQIFGIGGNRLALYSHPYPKIRLYNEGGWTIDLIRERVPEIMVPEFESIETVL